MSCTIEWQSGSLEPWLRAFGTARKSTLLQHLPYALAQRDLQQLGMRQGLIHVNGTLAGVVQIGEAGIFGNTVHAVCLDRGPIFFDPKPSVELVQSFFKEFRRQFPRRWGRKLRVIPEVDRAFGSVRLEGCGFAANARISPYLTAWLDLTPATDILRASIRGNWRNALSRAERSPIEPAVDQELATLPAFLATYASDMESKNFSGPSVALIATLVRHMRKRDEVLLINALEGGNVVASVLILQHGLAATYQCGWTTERGRACNAHHLLLWTAVKHLKGRGVCDLDLGGLLGNGQQAGLRQFKLGLGAKEVELSGAFN